MNKLIKPSFKLNKWHLILIVIFLVTFFFSYLTPKNQDDYGYYLLGLSLDKHITHYLTWSGRFIIDYYSCLVTAIDNKLIMAIINGLAVPLLIYNMIKIPFYNDQIDTSKLWIMGGILFITFWLTNPALGETTFWTVGAANYLWPLVIISTYIRCLLQCLNTHNNYKNYIILGILAFLSGCSNEAASVTIGYVTACLIIFAYITEATNKKITIYCLIMLGIGSAILILAPGNFARASAPILDSWRALTLSERLTLHFYGTVPAIFKSYGVIYFILLWCFGYGWKFLAKKEKQLTIIFMSAAVAFSVILIASPMAYKVRTYTTGVFFLWITLCFLLKAVITNSKKVVSKFSYFLLLLYISLFIVSLVYATRAYVSLYKQEQIRLAIINKEISQDKNIIYIPSYFALFTLNIHHLPAVGFEYYEYTEMAKYYNRKKIYVEYVGFDYESILNSKNEKNLIKQQSIIKGIYTQKQFAETVFIIEFTSKIAHHNNYKRGYSVKVSSILQDGQESYFVNLPLTIVKIDDRYFGFANALTHLLLENNPQHKVRIQVYDRDEQKKALMIPEYNIILD